MEANDPSREISDADFERMVREAESKAQGKKIRVHHVRSTLTRFGKIRAFQIPLSEITLDELTAHFAYVRKCAAPRPV